MWQRWFATLYNELWLCKLSYRPTLLVDGTFVQCYVWLNKHGISTLSFLPPCTYKGTSHWRLCGGQGDRGLTQVYFGVKVPNVLVHRHPWQWNRLMHGYDGVVCSHAVLWTLRAKTSLLCCQVFETLHSVKCLSHYHYAYTTVFRVVLNVDKASTCVKSCMQSENLLVFLVQQDGIFFTSSWEN